MAARGYLIAAADLIVTKILAGRPNDLEDASSRGPPYWKSTVLRRKALDKIAFQQATPQSTRTAREMCAPASPLLSPRTLHGVSRREV